MVFPLEAPSVTACGAYGKPTKLVFDDVTDVSQFSIDAMGTHAVVHGTHGGRTGVIALKAAGENEWAFDVTFEASLALLATSDRVQQALLSPTAELFVGAQSAASSDLRVYHYAKTMVGWMGPIETKEVAGATDESVTPGGELEVTDPNIVKLFRYEPVVHLVDATLRRSIAIAFTHPIDNPSTWLEQMNGMELNTARINEAHQPSQGAMAHFDQQLVLVYAATPLGRDTGSDLYVSAKDFGEFPLGTRIDELTTGAEEVEPFVNADCSKLYFRRGNDILLAERQ